MQTHIISNCFHLLSAVRTILASFSYYFGFTGDYFKPERQSLYPFQDNTFLNVHTAATHDATCAAEHYLFRPLMMKALPECWVSSFFITLYSSRFNCKHKHTVHLQFTLPVREWRSWRRCVTSYPAHFFIENIPQVGNVFEDRHIATYPTAQTKRQSWPFSLSTWHFS